MTIRNFTCIVLLLVLAATVSAHYDDCVYSIFVKTGDKANAGTDSKINLTLSNAHRKSLKIPDLEKWGIMGSKHDYFEIGSLDIFSSRQNCLFRPICKIKLGSDGRGDSPGWFVDYIELTVSQVHVACSRSVFPVNAWLGLDDPPYELTVTLESCKNYASLA